MVCARSLEYAVLKHDVAGGAREAYALADVVREVALPRPGGRHEVDPPHAYVRALNRAQPSHLEPARQRLVHGLEAVADAVQLHVVSVDHQRLAHLQPGLPTHVRTVHQELCLHAGEAIRRVDGEQARVLCKVDGRALVDCVHLLPGTREHTPVLPNLEAVLRQSLVQVRQHARAFRAVDVLIHELVHVGVNLSLGQREEACVYVHCSLCIYAANKH